MTQRVKRSERHRRQFERELRGWQAVNLHIEEIGKKMDGLLARLGVESDTEEKKEKA